MFTSQEEEEFPTAGTPPQPPGKNSASEDKKCPFLTSAAVGLATNNASVAKCPAFERGCPFKDATSQAELVAALERVPQSHGEAGTPAQVALARMLGATHKSVARGGECPFKHIEPLRRSAEREWRGWWSAHADEDEDDDNEDVDTNGSAAPKKNDAPAETQPVSRHTPAADAGNTSAPPRSSTSYGKKGMDMASSEGQQPLLSALLKAGTERVHAEAENVQFVKALVSRTAPLEAYVAMLARLSRVYDALERAMDDAEKQRGRHFFADDLRRGPSLQADLAYFRSLPDAQRLFISHGGQRGERAVQQTFSGSSPATDAYVARLEALRASRADSLLAAHCYTRYLGDLSGGQVLKRAVKRGLLRRGPGDDADEKGLAFYDFTATIGGPIETRRFKDRYRAALDAAAEGLAPADIDAVVSEAVDAFRHNTNLLAELDAFLPSPPSAPDAHQNIQTTQRPSSENGGVCPFLAGNTKEGLAAPASARVAGASRAGACPFLTGKTNNADALWTGAPHDEGTRTPDTAELQKQRLPPEVASKTRLFPAHFGKRDVAVVAALAVVFIVLPQFLAA